MKIGIDASRANNLQKTGVEWYAYFLLQELKKIIPENVEVILYSREDLQGDLADLPKNWSNKVLSWPPKMFWTQVRLSLEMLFSKVDVLFVPAHVVPMIHPKKTVMTVHDVAAQRFPDSYNWFENWYSLFSARFALKKIWKIITPSKFTKDELQHFFADYFQPEKIKVIYHGFNNLYQKKYSLEEKNNILQKYKIKNKFLLSISRLEYKKNTVGIIKSFEILKTQKNYQDLQLVLVGKPAHGFAEIKQVLENSPYRQDIILPGWVAENDLPIILSAAQVFVFPSLYEGFGLPVLQAFASSVPVVTSSDSSLSEISKDAAMLVKSDDYQAIADAIKQLLSDENLRQEKIKLGLQRASEFSWEKCGRETWRVLK